MEQALTTINQNSPSEISVIKAALTTPKVLNALPYEIDGAISMAVERAIFFLGLKTPEDDRDGIKITVIADVKKAFTHLTVGELGVAIDNGVRGKYGAFIGLSPKDIYNWILAYSISHERKISKGEIELIEENKEPTADEKFTIGKQLCIDLFEKFKIAGQLDRTALAVYEFLKSANLIDDDYRKGIYPQAMEDTIAEKSLQVGLCMDLHKRRGLNAELECLTDNISKDMLTTEQHSEVLRTGRKIILKNIFRDMIINEQDLAELIEMKRAVIVK